MIEKVQFFGIFAVIDDSRAVEIRPPADNINIQVRNIWVEGKGSVQYKLYNQHLPVDNAGKMSQTLDINGEFTGKENPKKLQDAYTSGNIFYKKRSRLEKKNDRESKKNRNFQKK